MIFLIQVLEEGRLLEERGSTPAKSLAKADVPSGNLLLFDSVHESNRIWFEEMEFFAISENICCFCEAVVTLVVVEMGKRNGNRAGKEVAMSMEESAKKPSRPQLVKLDKALKLAENWVNNMTKSTEEESGEVELEGRPLRLGLGATVPQQSKVGPLNDPVDRRLHAKLEAGKRKASQRMEESSPSVRGGHNVKDDEDDDDDLDSRTNLFAKKRVMPLTSSLQAKKKQKIPPRPMDPKKDLAVYGCSTVAWKDRMEEWKKRQNERRQVVKHEGHGGDDSDGLDLPK
ncbi:hypothetical protein RHGRI_028876 [Rhododendron griersonianum]|uniref:Uncharacterized protein n=1 Tax=Rhododendron griersonianum TaxID=479676 RepID=A0AAV6IJC1_9ERIC|nr:hypothetical protein RHGRI_028876 [Rhododendron griersonianum]